MIENGVCSHGCENMQEYLVVGSRGLSFFIIFFLSPPSWLEVGRWWQTEAAGSSWVIIHMARERALLVVRGRVPWLSCFSLLEKSVAVDHIVLLCTVFHLDMIHIGHWMNQMIYCRGCFLTVIEEAWIYFHSLFVPTAVVLWFISHQCWDEEVLPAGQWPTGSRGLGQRSQ